MEIQVKNNLFIDTDKESILLNEQEIGYVNITQYDEKVELYIFIEEEYRFHQYATDCLKKLIDTFFKKDDVNRIVMYVENGNRPGLNLMGKLNVFYVCFDEESNEHIYGINKEQYLNRTKQKKEIFDTYDQNLNKLDFDWERGRKYPSGLYHMIVSVLVVSYDKTILITLRHPNKTHPLCYEIPTGSVLKGETPRQGAVRELYEETGLKIKESDLIEFNRMIYSDAHVFSFVTFLNLDDYHIELQEEETIDYTTVTFNEFAQIVENVEFNPINRKTINNGKKKLNEIIQNHF